MRTCWGGGGVERVGGRGVLKGMGMIGRGLFFFVICYS